MGKDKQKSYAYDRSRTAKKNKKKDVCCQKYLKKGKHCKGCPDAVKCDLPEN